MRIQRHLIIWCGFMSAVLASVDFSVAQDRQINWRRDMKVAYKEAQATGKPMFVQMTASWCGHCTKMKQTTFSDPQVIAFLNENFIPLMVDTEQNEKFAQAVGVQGLPTTVIISPQLEMSEKLEGFHSSWELTKALNAYQRPQRDIEAIAENPQPEERDPFVRTADVRPRAMADRSSGEPADHPIAPSAYDQPVLDSEQVEANIEFTSEEVADSVSDDTAGEPIAPVAGEMEEQEESSSSEPSLPPLAFDGHCLVSALDDRQLVEGLPEFGVVYSRRMVFFASNAHREAFIADPNAYWPENNGNCPVSAADSGEARPGHLMYATVYHNRLWLFADEECRDMFMERPRDYVRSDRIAK